ncbi:MAG: radical SAM family heme chaperone HemW [Fusobacteriaceae bacterium]|jgi:oxygen-independent coproporphyrinogen-3 oxidase|nr:radical SAM family heme chaperone HemW [Fusobacteriaceae bacterium]
MNIDAIYIHIPFCIKKCDYCDFLSFQVGCYDIDKYVDYLLREIKFYGCYSYDTVYIGGGTPSILDLNNIDKILSSLNIQSNAEITIEVNPGTINLEKIKNYRKLGINRLSIGIQTFNNKYLKILGRIHNANEGKEAYFNAIKGGFDNINLDLMFSLPGQNLLDIENDLEELFLLNPPHFSIYSLIWENGTKFYEKLKLGEFNITDNDLEAQMYEKIIDEANKNEYIHYEISNFSKNNYSSRHNLKYWKNKNYIGVGLGASGYVGKIRYKNLYDFDEYYKKIDERSFPIDESENEVINTKNELEKYSAILNLRLLKDGYTPKNENFLKTCKNLEKKSLLININGKYILSRKGLLFANDVMEEFL